MTTRTLPMSQRRYRKEGGCRCPFCDSENLSQGFVEIDAQQATQEANCDDCGKEWTDTYQLSGYQERP
jgi:transcription elongation factor Elf1